MRIWLALRIMVRTLLDRRVAEQVGRLLEPPAPERQREPPAAAPAALAPQRNDALTLLAALQREARFIDIVREPLGEYSDEQIGAAARDVLRDCGAVLERMFAPRPLADQTEGSEIETPGKIDAGLYRVTGKVQGQPPYRGNLVHHGWKTTRCDLPAWSGSSEAASVLAPVELEVR